MINRLLLQKKEICMHVQLNHKTYFQYAFLVQIIVDCCFIFFSPYLFALDRISKQTLISIKLESMFHLKRKTTTTGQQQ